MAQVEMKFQTSEVIEFAGGEAGLIQVDAAQLASPAVQAYIFQYGLKQMLNDVHAGETAKKTPDEKTRRENKQALVAKKLASLYAGEVAQARIGAGDPVGRKMRELAEADLKVKMRTLGRKVSEIDKAVWAEVISKQVASKEAAYRAAAEKILSVKVETVADDGLDILALLEAEAEAEATE
jgi:hypothetical protein